jgi:hypothetical protein
MGRPQNVTEEQFQALSATLKERFAGIDDRRCRQARCAARTGAGPAKRQ